jgi:DNA polymerase III sliding clamp (beta) subunit (PCNA family)
MNTITLPAKILQAARLFHADVDARHYLKGIFIDPKGIIYASNGHYLMRAKCDDAKSDDRDILDIRINGSAFPKKAATASLSWHDGERHGIIEFLDSNGIAVKNKGFQELRTFSFIDGAVPDFERVIPVAGKDLKPLPNPLKIGLNLAYVALVDKAIKIINAREYGAEVNVFDANSSILIVPRSVLRRQLKACGIEVSFIIMTQRLEE